MKLTLIGKNKETEDVRTFIFKPDMPVTWKAGQYLIYSLPHKNQDLRGKMRFFTISSSPFKNYPQITTRISQNSSSFKKALDNLKKGQEIEAKGPDGDFVIENVKNMHIFIAGGIGITPFISIIRQLNYEKNPVNATLLYANKTKENILFEKELEQIRLNHPEFKIFYFYSPKRIDKNALQKYINKKNIFYVSGPDPMVEVLEKVLNDMRIPTNRQKYDYFSGYKSI